MPDMPQMRIGPGVSDDPRTAAMLRKWFGDQYQSIPPRIMIPILTQLMMKDASNPMTSSYMGAQSPYQWGQRQMGPEAAMYELSGTRG
jgi:hypothetical protein